MDAFKYHLGQVYRTPHPPDLNQISLFLNNLTLPRLNEHSVQELETKLTLQEAQEALQQLPKSKAPGTDGFPAEVYQTFSPSLKQHLLEVFLEARDAGVLRPLCERVLSL